MKNPEVRCKKEAIQHFNTYSYLVTEPVAAVVVDDFVVSALTWQSRKVSGMENTATWCHLDSGAQPFNDGTAGFDQRVMENGLQNFGGFIQVLLRDTTESYTNFD